jgi:hypothetical protein
MAVEFMGDGWRRVTSVVTGDRANVAWMSLEVNDEERVCL